MGNTAAANWNARYAVALAFLALVPNVLGFLNIQTPWGFQIHTFPVAIFLAAFVYGPLGGAIAGLAGSVATALALSNPFVLLGNAILGFVAGHFFRNRQNILTAVLSALAAQIAWAAFTNYFLMNYSGTFVLALSAGLALSNLAWGFAAGALSKPLRRLLEC